MSSDRDNHQPANSSADSAVSSSQNRPAQSTRIAAFVIGGAGVLGIAVLTLFAQRLERPFLRMIGAVVGGVKDHFKGVIVVAVIAAIIVWAVIACSCFIESRRRQSP